MYRIGIDLGGTNTVAGLVDEKGQIIDRKSVKTNLPTALERIVESISVLTDGLLNANGISRAQVVSVGVGVPCTADEKTGWMLDADHLGFPGGPLQERLEAVLQLPVAIGNDANCAAWGEYKAGGYEEDSFILVTLGTGIGGGIIAGGKLWNGVNNAAGELGHMTIHMGGEPCCCGREGCFEAYGSALALTKQASRATGEQITEAKTVFDRAAAGDEICIRVLEHYTTYLAEGLANIINIFAPAYLCIGGGVSHAGDVLLAPVREKTMARVYAKTAQKNTQIILAKLGNDAGILGAAFL